MGGVPGILLEPGGAEVPVVERGVARELAVDLRHVVVARHHAVGDLAVEQRVRPVGVAPFLLDPVVALGDVAQVDGEPDVLLLGPVANPAGLRHVGFGEGLRVVLGVGQKDDGEGRGLGSRQPRSDSEQRGGGQSSPAGVADSLPETPEPFAPPTDDDIPF